MQFRLPKTIEPVYKLDGEVLTREDFRYLYVIDQLSMDTIAYLLGVDTRTLFYFTHGFKVNLRKIDMYIYGEAVREFEKDNKKRMVEFDDEISRKLMDKAIVVIGRPRPETEYVYVNGKRCSDDSLLREYEEELQTIFEQMVFHNNKKKIGYTSVRHVDLSAMRLHRGLNMMQFSEKSGIPYKVIVYYEKTANVMVPKEMADIYRNVLNISSIELKKIRECLSGERKDMFEEENRSIPESVRNYVFNRDGGKCRKCSSTKFIHYHHVDHYAAGGKHQARNLMLLCIACHAMEHYGEKSYPMMKAKAEKLGVFLDVG